MSMGGRVVKNRHEIHSLKLTWPVKMMVSNRNLLFQGLFSGDMLVSGNVGVFLVLMRWQDVEMTWT